MPVLPAEGTGPGPANVNMAGAREVTGARSRRPAHRGCRGGRRARRARRGGGGGYQPAASDAGVLPRRVERSQTLVRTITKYDRAQLLAVRRLVRDDATSDVTERIRHRLPPRLSHLIRRTRAHAHQSISVVCGSGRQHRATTRAPEEPSHRTLTQPARLTISETRRLTKTANTGLLIGVLNIQSLKPKLLELTEELNRHDFDACLLAETWLRPSTPNRLLVIPGYSLSRVDRPDGSGYGGVAVLSKTDMKTVTIKPSTSPHPGSLLETRWMLFKLERNRQLIVCSVYRPPRQTDAALRADFSDLETQLQRVLIDFPKIPFMICGDLNCDMLKEESFRARVHLSDFLSNYSLEQLVTVPTYTSGSLLDVCMVKNRELVRDCCASFCHFSPHKLLRVSINVPKQRKNPTVVQSRSINRIDVEALNSDLMSADWEGVFSATNVTDQWDSFLTEFLPIFDDHAPIKNITIRNPTAPPVTPATLKIMDQRRAALRQFGRKSEVYKDLNRNVRAAVRRDRRGELQREISGRGPNKVWKCIRSVVAGKKDGPSVQPDVSADVLNSFFVSVGPRVAREIRDQNPAVEQIGRLPRVVTGRFKPSPTSLGELGHTVFHMRNSAACAADGVCIRMLKASFPAIGDVILHIINTCILRSDIPHHWKHSIVHPIFKSGNPSDPTNFRPISLVPVIMKVVERVIHKQLYRYLSQNHLLANTQHGFRPRHSTETALLSVTDRILAATDRGEVSMLCLVDLSKCFDVINHELLLAKLAMHGIETSWFAAYLQGHTQSVSLKDESGCRVLSQPLPNSMGVFQGSALGPLLFTVFSNDLSLYSEDAAVFQYADDTQLLVSGPLNDLRGLISRMEVSLASLDHWFSANALKVNTAKTQLMVFGSRQNLRSIPVLQFLFAIPN